MTTNTISVLILSVSLNIGSASQNAPRKTTLKGPVSTVLAERMTVDADSVEPRHRVPWYRQTYDEKGNLIESIFFKEDGSVNNSWVYLFDAEGRLREATVRNGNDTILWREVYGLDNRSNVIQAEVFGPDGSTSVRYSYSYDEAGNRTEWLRSEKAGTPYRLRTYAHDSVGRVIEEHVYASPGMLDSRVLYAYNAQGATESTIEYAADGSLRHYWVYDYKYDSNGNWIEQIVSERHRTKSRKPKSRAVERIYLTIDYFARPEKKAEKHARPYSNKQ